RRRNAMPDIKGRREPNPARPRPRPHSERSPADFGKDILDEVAPKPTADGSAASAAPASAAPGSAAPASAPSGSAPPGPAALREAEHIGFDEETNNRYEEIKRGTTFISELQAMTIPELIKTAKAEGVAEYTGLKKQDLIFK